MMAWNKRIAKGLITLLVTSVSLSIIPVKTASASPQILARVTPSTVTGQLDRNSQIHWDGSYYNIYTFDGQAGEVIRIDMISNDFDAYLILFDPQGGRITQNDDGGDGTNARNSCHSSGNWSLSNCRKCLSSG